MSSTQPLSREKIAAAAIAIADAEGIASVSMRRIAQDLGVGTMSLYYYVKTKGDLIAAMDDAIMAEVVALSLPANWRAALVAIATRTRDALMRHPWALHSMLAVAPGVNAMRHFEQCLQALAQTALTSKEKFTLLATLDDFVFGYALREAAADKKVDLDFAKAQLATGQYPRLAEVFGEGRVPVSSDRFQLGLGLILDMVAESS
ncbi:MAG TPA: TetR/AcrR family transcriptional regulator C-terminal domain-containing protein [Steroidobacteraceae bacterium]|nr:TetR/AcrR family transcriptional regulator C-terminal domain-containing protein [Steroidobacteraceae bacterium]